MTALDPLQQLLASASGSAEPEVDALEQFVAEQLAATGEWESARTSDGVSSHLESCPGCEAAGACTCTTEPSPSSPRREPVSDVEANFPRAGQQGAAKFQVDPMLDWFKP